MDGRLMVNNSKVGGGKARKTTHSVNNTSGSKVLPLYQVTVVQRRFSGPSSQTFLKRCATSSYVFALHLPNTVILLLHIVIVISSLYSISCMMEEGLLLFGSSSNFSLLVYYCVCVPIRTEDLKLEGVICCMKTMRQQ